MTNSVVLETREDLDWLTEVHGIPTYRCSSAILVGSLRTGLRA